MTDKKEEIKHCCGTCIWFNGDLEDNDQFCDELETEVNAKNFCCNRWKAKYQEVANENYITGRND